MGDSFAKIKHKFTVAAIVKSIVVGVCCGLVAFGALLLATKLNGETRKAWVYVVTLLAVTLPVGGLTYLLLRPTDYKLAKRLDHDYNLRERVQTALAYSSSSGEMVDAQREDTSQTLANLRLRKPTFKQMWQYCVLAVLAVALAVTSIAIPDKTDGTQPETPAPTPTWTELPFELSATQRMAIEGLFDNDGDVSYLDYLGHELQADVTVALEQLIEELDAATTNGQMETAVKKAVKAVDDAVKGACSYYVTGVALLSRNSNDMAQALAYGVEYYKNINLTTNAEVRDFYQIKGENTDLELSLTLDTIHEAVVALVGNGVGSEAKEYVNNIMTALNVVDLQDGLCDTLEQFCLEISSPLTSQQLENAFANFAMKLSDELSVQAYSFVVDKYIASTLDVWFSVENTSLAATIGWNLKGLIPVEGDSGDGKENGGGYGEGGNKLGSDDLIYDPVSGEYVPYGELINRYYAIVNSLVNEGLLTEQQARVVQAYFEMLFSGIKEN